VSRTARPFEVIPAVDVSRGRLARLHAGGIVPVGAFGGDPVAAAREFAAAGAVWAHVVDLDLAFTGVAGNIDLIGAIAHQGLRIQASGGLATVEEVDALLAAGAARAVLGSAALSDPGAVAAAAERYGERLVVGLEVEGEIVRPRGRAAEGSWALGEVLDALRSAPVARFLVTAVERVGGMAGPDLGAVGRVARETGRPVVAAGGIAGPADVAALAGLEPAIEGAVVGRALYEGTALREFLAAARPA